MALHRRTLLRSLPLVAVTAVPGCGRLRESPQLTLRMVRVINLAERAVPVELTASREGRSDVLYSGTVGTQGPAAGDGEVVLQPGGIDEPLQYDYRLSVDGTRRERLDSAALGDAHRRESADRRRECVELAFGIRNPDSDAGVGGDYTFWERCDAAPGTVDPTTSS